MQCNETQRNAVQLIDSSLHTHPPQMLGLLGQVQELRNGLPAAASVMRGLLWTDFQWDLPPAPGMVYVAWHDVA